MRGIQYAAAFRFYHRRLWMFTSPRLRGEVGAQRRVRGTLRESHAWIEPLTPPSPRKSGARENKTHLRDPAARFARVMPLVSRHRNRGRGECRMRAAPAVSCAVCTKRCAHEHTGSAEAIRHSLRNGFTAYNVLSSATNSFCHRHRRINGFVGPGWADETSADLAPATGARTTRFRRTLQRRSSACRMIAHGSKELPCDPIARATLPRPPHPTARFVTTRDPPLSSGETGGEMPLICPVRARGNLGLDRKN